MLAGDVNIFNVRNQRFSILSRPVIDTLAIPAVRRTGDRKVSALNFIRIRKFPFRFSLRTVHYSFMLGDSRRVSLDINVPDITRL